MSDKPTRGQTRLQTKDKIVIVTDTLFREDGDFDQSVRCYGPFESADEQREFMRKVILESPMTDEVERDKMLRLVSEWRRVDEEAS